MIHPRNLKRYGTWPSLKGVAFFKTSCQEGLAALCRAAAASPSLRRSWWCSSLLQEVEKSKTWWRHHQHQRYPPSNPTEASWFCFFIAGIWIYATVAYRVKLKQLSLLRSCRMGGCHRCGRQGRHHDSSSLGSCELLLMVQKSGKLTSWAW